MSIGFGSVPGLVGASSCQECGAIVLHQTLHEHWHRTMEIALTWALPSDE